ncbi:MAG TPA: nuclear transport factor 2 family protein [Candidatus Saccharimonadales bacterium]|nr:nuclear transport factor 2 family protein [Candidatus Saccharimonadales bacterium]
MPDDKSQIKEIIENWTKAVQDEDINRILSHHAENIVMFDVPPPLQSKGIEAYKKTWDTFFSWSKKPRVFNITELEITASDTVAFCHGIGHCSGISKEGVEEKLEFRLTVGLIKENNEWIITHEHHSLPSE